MILIFIKYIDIISVYQKDGEVLVSLISVLFKLNLHETQMEKTVSLIQEFFTMPPFQNNPRSVHDKFHASFQFF